MSQEDILLTLKKKSNLTCRELSNILGLNFGSVNKSLNKLNSINEVKCEDSEIITNYDRFGKRVRYKSPVRVWSLI